ncbi:MAG: endolytic transglycosylase MltG [Pseudobutyrivibrio sp.]|nr:endolytic transglycosylase MltG [Pseudobutyrivibrio sp.]
MKLKYYLRGAGFGIIISTIILTIAFAVSKPSVKDTIDAAENEPVETEEAPTEAPTEAIDIETTKIVDKPKIENEASNLPDVTPLAEESTEVEEYRPFTVEKGQSSNQVAIKLKESGFIEDSDDFNKYITDLGMSNRIQPGSFYIKVGSEYEDIAAILVTKPEDRSSLPQHE